MRPETLLLARIGRHHERVIIGIEGVDIFRLLTDNIRMLRVLLAHVPGHGEEVVESRNNLPDVDLPLASQLTSATDHAVPDLLTLDMHPQNTHTALLLCTLTPRTFTTAIE